MKKRVLAALLALVMLFGALPMSVFAEDLETVEEPSGTFGLDEPEKYTYHLIHDFNYEGGTTWDIQATTATTPYKLDVNTGTPEREGYNFLGWADKSNATTAKYHGGDLIELDKDNLTKTIYAVWEEQPQPDITDPKDFAKTLSVFVQCKDNKYHYVTKQLEYLTNGEWAVEWTPGSKEATLKLYPAKIAPLYKVGGEHKAVDESTVTVTLAYTNRWSIAGRIPAIPTIKITCAAPEIPDPTDDVKERYVTVVCDNKTAHHNIQYQLKNLPAGSMDVQWDRTATTAKLVLKPEKIAEHYGKSYGAHTAVNPADVEVPLTYANDTWSLSAAIPDVHVTCKPTQVIPSPTDSVKEQYVTVVCDNKTAHQNIQYQLENLPAGSVDVQWDGAAKTAKLVLKPDKIAEHYGMAYGAHTAVNPADVEVSLTYANDAWSLSAAIPDVHVTCKPAQEIPNPKDSFNKLLVNVACNTENSGHDPIEVPLTEVASSVEVQWEPNTAVAYITLKPTAFAAYYSQHNNGAHDPVDPAAVKVEAHYDNEKGWIWTKPTINVKCEPVYTITYNWRGVVKPTDVRNVNNPETFTADELPITLKAPDFKNNEWPQKFLNWRDAAGNVVTQITEPGNVELYAYYQFPVKYTVYDENGQKVDNLSVTDWYNEDDFAVYSLRSGEKTGHDFDGWYQTTKDFGNTNKRVTKLNMAKKYELVGKLTRKEYTVTASLFLNGSEEATKDARGVVISRSVKGLYGDPINYDGENGLNAQLKEAALAADAANEPNPDYVDINICLNDKSGNPFAAETYGQEGYNWRDMQWPENNPTKKWIVAYAWAYVDTYYDVTFNVNMEGVAPVDTQTVKCNATANEPTAPTKEGYKFLGWFKDGENTAFDFDTPITQKTELTAKWELNLQTVNVVIYRNGDMTKSFKTVALEKQPKGTVIDLATLNIADYYEANYSGKYDFYGWYNDHKWNNYKANPETPPAGLDTITVNGWTNIICMVYDHEKVVVKALYDGSTDVKNAEVLYTTTARKGLNTNEVLNGLDLTLDKTGHTHDEWFNDSITYKFGENDTINGWTNAYVKYTRKSYNVVAKLYLNGQPVMKADGTSHYLSDAISGLYGETINYSAIETWAKDLVVNDIDKDNTPDAAATTVKIYKDGGKYEPNDTFGNPDVSPNYVWADVTTYYKVAFNSDGGSAVDAQTVKYGETLAAFDEPTKDGYKFLGWFTEADEAFDLTTPITKSMTLTAKWERNTYTIIYHGNGGVKVKGDKTYEQVTSAKLPIGEPTTLKSAEFTRDNYRFLGWSYFENGSVYFNAAEKNVLFEESDIDENGNVHLYAIWKRLSYPVTLRYNANTTDEVTNMPEPLEQTKDSDETGNAEFNISGMIPGRAGYRFLGWAVNKPDAAEDDIDFKAGESSIFVVNYQDDITLYAVWQELYTVTYSYDPSLPAEVQATIPKDPDTYTVGQKVTTAAKPNSVRVGENIWTFKTWKLDGVEVAPNTQVEMVSGGLHFEGIWETKLIHYSLTIQYVDKKGKELAESHMDLLSKGEAYKVDSPKIKGYKLKDKDDAVIKGTMPGRNLTIEVVYIKKSTGGGSGTIDSPNKPTTKAPALTLNTDDHFAFINGYPDGSVQPEGNVTRAETAAILYRIMGDACQSYYKTNSSSYSDVVRGDWYNTYVATLENAGVIVDTRTNGKFRPNDAITRAELASMIAQFAGLESASAAKFNDVGSRYWAAEEIAIAAKMGWINGYPDGSFRPDRNVTRAELMAMVNRALGRTPKSADDLLSGMKTWRDNANVNAWYYLDVQEATNDHTYTKSGTHETWKKLL